MTASTAKYIWNLTINSRRKESEIYQYVFKTFFFHSKKSRGFQVTPLIWLNGNLIFLTFFVDDKQKRTSECTFFVVILSIFWRCKALFAATRTWKGSVIWKFKIYNKVPEEQAYISPAVEIYWKFLQISI